MKLEDIGFYTLLDERAKNSSSESQLWRCELILTDACNFTCEYCRPLRSDCKGTLPIARAKEIVLEWTKAGLKNIRFSGGEPTLYKQLVELVQFTKANNVERIAISTNGSASLELYKRLIEAGVNDFSISLDACCASEGDKIAGGIPGVWEKVVENIKEISKLAYTTVGVVLTKDNLASVIDIVKFSHELGVSDIRVIPAAQLSKKLGEEFIVNAVDSEVLTQHPILRYRMENVAKGLSVRGLGPNDSKRCPLVLDDMAVAGNYHFPCIIYLREGGQPIGKMTDIQTVRAERKEWFEKHNVRTDLICRGNCLEVCSEYNRKWEEFHK